MSKYFCLKNVLYRRRPEQSGATQLYHKRGSGGEVSSCLAIFVIFRTK